jgi:hypothetical protein
MSLCVSPYSCPETREGVKIIKLKVKATRTINTENAFFIRAS